MRKNGQVKIDEIDTKILKTLLKDARTGFAEIARDCQVSTNAVVKRYYRLQRTGVIIGTSLMPNLEEFGYKFALSIGIDIEKSQEANVLEAIKKIPITFDLEPQVGKFDVHGVGAARSLEEINQLRDAIKNEKGVKSVKITANLDKQVFFMQNLVIEPTEDS